MRKGILQTISIKETCYEQQSQKINRGTSEPDLLDELEIIKDEENEAYDNMPESLQESERGQIAQEASDNLDSAYDSLQEAIEYLEEAKA